MKISKITQGYVLQTYDTETGEHFDVDDSETELEYQPYEMEQPVKNK